jgi:hypothetical protein
MIAAGGTRTPLYLTKYNALVISEAMLKKAGGLFYDGLVSLLTGSKLRVKNFREPGSEPAVSDYPGE